MLGLEGKVKGSHSDSQRTQSKYRGRVHTRSWPCF